MRALSPLCESGSPYASGAKKPKAHANAVSTSSEAHHRLPPGAAAMRSSAFSPRWREGAALARAGGCGTTPEGGTSTSSAAAVRRSAYLQRRCEKV